MANSPASPADNAATPLDVAKRADNMAQIFQEVFTVVMRLRASRQRFGDPVTFRNQIKNAFNAAEAEGTRRGYLVEDMRVGKFAVVAFLDESILSSQNPIFADWQRKPLQEELFGIVVAGDIFYRNVERLLSRPNNEALADLLEVHQLCLLMGFRGRYSATGMAGEIRSIVAQIEEKIRRIRGDAAPLAWQPPGQTLRPAADKWTPALKWTALACVCLALLLFIFYKVSLASSAGDLTNLAAGAVK